MGRYSVQRLGDLRGASAHANEIANIAMLITQNRPQCMIEDARSASQRVLYTPEEDSTATCPFTLNTTGEGEGPRQMSQSGCSRSESKHILHTFHNLGSSAKRVGHDWIDAGYLYNRGLTAIDNTSSASSAHTEPLSAGRTPWSRSPLHRMPVSHADLAIT